MLAHDHGAGLAALGRAVELNPNSALALGFSSLVRCFAGDYGASAELARRALRLSPLDPLRYLPLLALAYAALFTGRPEEGADHARQMIQANPGFENGHAALVACLIELGRLEEVREAARLLMSIAPGFRIARRRRAGWRDAAKFEGYLAALGRAGLPD